MESNEPKGDPVLAAADFVLKHTPGSEDAMPIQAIMCVVGIDEEGEKWVSHFRSGDLRTWEARGLVEDLRDTLAAQEFVRQLEVD